MELFPLFCLLATLASRSEYFKRMFDLDFPNRNTLQLVISPGGSKRSAISQSRSFNSMTMNCQNI